MKKVVAISILLALLTISVYAQDESKWKVGLDAMFTTDALWATKGSYESETETSATGSATTKTTSEFGKYQKGSISWFGNYHGDGTGKDNANAIHSPAPDNRLTLTISNTGENYQALARIGLDNWAQRFAYRGNGDLNQNAYNDAQNVTVGQFLLNGIPYDYWLKGNAGIFKGTIGTEGWTGWVDPRAVWGQWNCFPNNEFNRFFVYTAKDGKFAGDNFRTMGEWGEIAAFGIQPIDMIQVAFGYRYTPGWGWNGQADEDPWASKSFINGSFMVSGRPVEGITFDLFYSVMGQDKNTLYRDSDGGSYHYGTSPSGADGGWVNLLGAYVGVDKIENLGLSLGYTMHFNVLEKGALADPETGVPYPNQQRTMAVTYNTPLTSGVDIKVKYSGIDKIGLNFNTNLSFAGTKGKGDRYATNKVPGTKVTEYTKDLGGNNSFDGQSDSWFHLHTGIAADLKLLDGVALVFSLFDELGVYSTKDTGDTQWPVSRTRTTESTSTGLPPINRTGS